MDAIWKKRFAKELDLDIAHFLCSIEDDERLIAHDISANRAHIRMLKKNGLITARDHARMDRALQDLNAQYAQKKLMLDQACEDVHMNIEMQVKKRSGHHAGSLHMARSRNDLIATDMRLYARKSVVMLISDCLRAQTALVNHARAHHDVVVPGYTHLQQAQPVLWAFYLLSIFFKLQRDCECLFDAYVRVNISPLGSCALAGTAHKIDPEFTAARLGFRRFADNSMDAVSDRDFLCEVAYVCAQIGTHFAALAEDLIIYTTQEFARIALDDAIATGSSIMPHKKNPDCLEMLRARAGSLIGHVVTLFTVIKGLPSSYNRDLQCTKRAFFDCIDTTHACLRILPCIIANMRLLKNDWATTPALCCATNVVDHLAAHKFTFRKAYHAVAACARRAQGKVDTFIKECAREFTLEPNVIAALLIPVNAVQAKCSKNSTGPAQVRKALARAQRIIRNSQRRIKQLRQ
ncbi:argininosuccinate lyase [candidate division WOR-3 bacterium]|nr:argininosuccinate lyase [candidate division WOR-3 bacterium]